MSRAGRVLRRVSRLSPPASLITGSVLDRLARFPGRRVLYVSPHLDDAVFSAGALMHVLAQRAYDQHAVTLFSGSAAEQRTALGSSMDAQGLLSATDADRRNEDTEAFRALGVPCTQLLNPTASNRTTPSGAARYGSFSDVVTSAPDAAHVAEAAAAISTAVEQFGPTVLACPVGVGNHVDHVATRRAAMEVARRLELPLLGWWDLPYGLGSAPRWTPHLTLALSPASAAAKEAAVSCYRSQVERLWAGGDWRADLCSTGPRSTERYVVIRPWFRLAQGLTWRANRREGIGA